MKKTSIPIKVSFNDLKYTVQVANSKEQINNGASRYREEVILKSVSGYMLPG